MKTFWKPIVAVIVFLAMQMLGGAFLYIGNTLKLSTADSLSIAVILSGLMTVLILFSLRMISTKTFNPQKIRWKHIPLAIAAAMLGIIATVLLSEQFNLPDMMKEEFGEMAKSVWGIIAISFVGPIVEELVFREAIIRSLLHHHVHRWQAILISALAFGLIHINPAQIPFAFAMGVILAIIYVKTRSILITSFVHILNNSLAIIEINLLGEHIDELSYSEILGGNLITWAYILVCTALCVIFLMQFWNKYHRKH